MRLYYDTEFVEDGRTIDLLSVGMVREDNRELYLIVGDDHGAVIRAVNNEWLRDNVVRHLPIIVHDQGSSPRHGYRWDWEWDPKHPDFKHVHSRIKVRNRVRKFVAETPDVQLWADYSAYDHVAYAQLFGRMIELPADCPMDTMNVHQEQLRLGVPDHELNAALPLNGQVHSAAWDAATAKDKHELLMHIERKRFHGTGIEPYSWENR